MLTMHSTQINYLAEAGRTTYEFRPRVPLFAPKVMVWCVVTSVPLGVAGATVSAVLDMTRTSAFAETATTLTLISAAVLYVLLRLLTRSRVVFSVTFDVLAGTAEIFRRRANPQIYRCALLDVTSFYTEARQRGPQQTCALAMSRVGRPDIPLLEVDEKCHPDSQLVTLAERLNMALEASQSEITNPPDVLTQRQAYVPPTALRPAVPPPRRHEIEPPAGEDAFDERD